MASRLWARHPVGWLVALMLAAGAAFLALRMVTPGDGTQVPTRASAWAGDGVVAQVHRDGPLRERDLVTAIDGVALRGAGGWSMPSHRPGDRLTYRVVRGGHAREVTVTLRRADVASPLLRAWGTILFVVALFGVVAYLYARRAGPATAALLVLGSGLLASTLATEIGVSALDVRGGPVLWLYLLNTNAVYFAGWAGLVAFLLLFPRPWPPLARHRWLLPAACTTLPALLIAWALAALVAVGPVGFTGWVGRVFAGETVMVAALLGSSIVVAVGRYRTITDPVGRQQLRWLWGGGGLSAALALAVWYLPEAVAGEGPLPADWLGFSGLPGVAGLVVAVLRYRLFDLDRVISRTVAYALLTVLLGGAYAGVVLGLGPLVGRGSGLVVAAATLAAAALFRPARGRVQAMVDRRFDRRRYDGARTIEAFSGRLRQQIDLDTLTAELLAVVDQTMQPTHVSLWLRQPWAGRPVAFEAPGAAASRRRVER